VADPNFDSLLVMVQINPFFDELIEQYRWIHPLLCRQLEQGLINRIQKYCACLVRQRIVVKIDCLNDVSTVSSNARTLHSKIF
jgi:hypothetical protein